MNRVLVHVTYLPPYYGYFCLVPSSAQSIAFLQDILKAYARVGEVGEEVNNNSSFS